MSAMASSVMEDLKTIKDGELKTTSDSTRKSQSVLIFNKIEELKESAEVEILIEITNQKLTFTSRGAFFYNTNVVLNGKTISLRSLNYKKVLEVPKSNKINLKFRNAIRNSDIVLPKSVCDNFFSFITGGRRQGSNCIDFINDLFLGCGTQVLNHMEMNFYEKNNELVVGQPIMIGQESFCGNIQTTSQHFAIYLGSDLYMSVMGKDMPIFITTLEQMKLIYNVKNDFPILPKLRVEQVVSTRISDTDYRRILREAEEARKERTMKKKIMGGQNLNL